MQTYERFRDLFHRLNQEHVDLKAPLGLDEAGPEWLAASAELRAFLDQVVRTLTTVDQAIGKMGMKEALHVLQLRRLTEIMDAQNADVERLSVGVEELAKGVTRVAEDAHQVAQAAGHMKEAGTRSLEAVDQVLQAVGALEEQARVASQSVENMVQQTRAAGEGLRAVQGVAGTSRLLALNAAIQAAHANDRAFGVVAQEMRRLSDRTEQLVKQIEGQVGSMEAAILSAAQAMQVMAKTAGSTGADARTAAGGLHQVQGLLHQVSDAVESIAAVAEEQAAATEEIAATAHDLSGRTRAASDSMNMTRGLAISDVTEEAQAALGQFDIGSQSDRMRHLLDRASVGVEATVERLVAGGAVRLEELWDYQYQEIKGSAIASLGRLFRVNRVPAEGFNPPKYRTAYDQKIDQPLIDLMDGSIAEGRLQFCTVLDLNAFTMVHGRNLIHDWTGNHEQDLRTNRIKRLFTSDASARKASRMALPPALAEKRLIGPEDVARLPGSAPTRPFLLQTYALDSGVVVLAMTMPLFVGGRRWGAIRIGYQPEQ